MKSRKQYSGAHFGSHAHYPAISPAYWAPQAQTMPYSVPGKIPTRISETHYHNVTHPLRTTSLFPPLKKYRLYQYMIRRSFQSMHTKHNIQVQNNNKYQIQIQRLCPSLRATEKPQYHCLLFISSANHVLYAITINILPCKKF